MRQSNQIDLRTAAGSRSSGALAPGASVQFQFNAQQSRIGAGGGGKGLYNYIRGIILNVAYSLTQPGSSSAIIPGDSLYGAVGSINLNSPLFGTLIDPNVVQNGNIAKHFVEFHQLGYKRPSVDPRNVSATAATYTGNFEIYLPFAQQWNDWPDQFAHWLGWHDTATLEIFCNPATDWAGQTQYSTGGSTTPATLNNITITAKLDMVPWSEVIIPPIVTARKYTQAAASGSNGPTLIGVGNNGSLQGTDDMARLVSMVFAHNMGGFTGSGNANDISTVTLPWRDQQQTTEMDGFFVRFLNDAKRQQYGLDSIAACDTPEPYAMGETNQPGVLNLALNAQAARYTPFVWPNKSQFISQFQRVKGNYPLDMTFANAQNGMFTVYTHEMKQFSTGKVSEMLAAMGIDPTKVVLYPKFGMKNVKQVDPKKTFCFPRGIGVPSANG